MTIRDCLINAQKSLCVTQEELAALFGISRNTIVRYMSGNRRPGARTIRRITQVLKEKGLDAKYSDLMESDHKKRLNPMKFK